MVSIVLIAVSKVLLCCSVVKSNELNVLSIWKEDRKLRYFNYFTLP